jgi:hypothetical protein
MALDPTFARMNAFVLRGWHQPPSNHPIIGFLVLYGSGDA